MGRLDYACTGSSNNHRISRKTNAKSKFGLRIDCLRDDSE